MKNIAASIAAVCLFAAGSALAIDTEAPKVLSITIAPAPPVPAEGGVATPSVHITMHVTDDESGMEYGNVYLYNPDGHYVVAASFTAAQLIPGSGNALDGTYEFDVQIPPYVAAGPWRVDALMLDFQGHQRNLGISPNEPFPVPADATFTMVNTGVIDIAPPELMSYGVSSGTIFTGGGPVDVQFTFESKDLTSGFSYGYLFVDDPNGVSANNLGIPVNSIHRIEGDDKQGTYQVTVTFPQNSAVGSWNMLLFQQDLAGNYQFLPAGHVLVSSTVNASQSIGKAVEAVQFPWTTDTTSAWDYQTTVSSDDIDAAVSAPVADSEESMLQTTIIGPGTLSFQWKVDSEEFSDYLSVQVDEDEIVPGVYHEFSGNKDWEGLTLDIAPGPHTVTWRYRKDNLGTVGADRGWIDEVRFTAVPDPGDPNANPDTVAPFLQDLRISPRMVNVIDGWQEVTFTLEISDEFNGFQEGWLDLVMPSGTVYDSNYFSLDDRISGDDDFGTYELKLYIPDDEELGTWRVALSLYDQADYHERIYGPDDEDFTVAGLEQFVVTDGSGDVQAPLVETVEVVNPSPPDVGPAAATVTVKLHITDNLSGFSDGNVAVYTPDGHWTGSTYFSDGARVSGDRYDGMYEIVVPVPRYGPAGTWRVGCWLIDRRQNQREYPYDLALPGDPDDAEFQVTNSGQVDLLPPSVTSITIAPTTVDATAAATQVTVDVSISDDLSGLRNAYLFIFRPGDYDNNLYFSDLNPVSGTVNGSYQAQVALPQGSYGGTWLVRVYLVDMTGRSRYYGPNTEPYPSPDTGFFTVVGPPRSTLLSFTDFHHLHGDDALPGADPDHDGLNNATELILGGNPTDPATNGTGSIQILRDANSLHLEFTLAPSITATGNGTQLELTDTNGGPPLRLTGQTQGGLAGPWTDVPSVYQNGQTYRVSLPFSSGPSGFIRLKFDE